LASLLRGLCRDHPRRSGAAQTAEEPTMRIPTAILLALASAAVLAGTASPPNTIPEPGTLGLLGAAAVAGIAFVRGKRK